ncbi:MAG TPA: FkbM family methyltransferase, partial [Candidatus Binataceae bacterium]|nr:FkbM family methyltransferase [Candidatus Binataceae bacterium]
LPTETGSPPERTRSLAQAETVLFTKLKDFGYSPATIYDIGAAGGRWSFEISQVFPQASFTLFEPLADAERYRERLKHVLEAHPGFRLYPVALSSGNGQQEMSVFRNIVGSTLIDLPIGEYVQSKMSVESWRLDDFVAHMRLSRPNIIKMDVQGFELEVLKGAVRTISEADILLMETWLYREYGPRTPLLNEIITFLSPLAFQLTDFGGTYVGQRHRLCSIDAFFMSTRFLESIQSPSRGWQW